MVSKVFGTLGALIVVGAIVVGGYLGGWWLQSDVTNRQAHIDRQNNGTQLTYVNKVDDNIATVRDIDVQMATPGISADQKQALAAQQSAIVHATCKTYSLITDAPADEVQWAASNCN